MKICVTGGAGFIGHHTVRKLVSSGHEILVIDNLSTGNRENLPSTVEFVQADILEEDGSKAIIDFQPEAILHLAAKVTIRGSVETIAEDARQNFLGTACMLEAAIKAGTHRFVLASSMAIYKDASTAQPLNEEWPTKPLSPYGISKLASEQLVHLMGERFGMSTMALRFFNTYGTGQKLTPYVGVINIFIDRIRSENPPLIFGDGEQCRDFIYVGDVAQACRLALSSTDSGHSINIGTARALSVNQIAQLLLTRMRSSLAPVYAAAREEENRNSIADISLALEILGFQPQWTLEEKLDELIAR